MAKTAPFEQHSEQYEDWFTNNQYTYESELNAVRALLPESGSGVEIGVGSGRFAAPLGIKYGVEPSEQMRQIAEKRGIETKHGVAEDLPYTDETFDLALMVTTICFLDDIEGSLHEVYRILKPGGCFLVGFIDRESPLGRIYEQYKDDNVFYRIATFYTVDDVVSALRKTGFSDFQFHQTIFHQLDEIQKPEPVKPGYGEGSFVVIRAVKAMEE